MFEVTDNETRKKGKKKDANWVALTPGAGEAVPQLALTVPKLTPNGSPKGIGIGSSFTILKIKEKKGNLNQNKKRIRIKRKSQTLYGKIKDTIPFPMAPVFTVEEQVCPELPSLQRH